MKKQILDWLRMIAGCCLFIFFLAASMGLIDGIEVGL